jgi:hypothetical protein
VKIFWASCPPPFPLGDLTCLSFALLNNLYIYIYIYMCVCVCVCIYSVHRWIYWQYWTFWRNEGRGICLPL